MPEIEPPWCHRCGLAGPGPCLCIANAGQLWPLDGLRSAFLFESPVREAIYALKYANIRSIGKIVSHYMSEVVQSERLAFDLIVPVPLHRKRLRERGYNQAEIIALHLGRTLGVPVEGNHLRREVYASPQARAANADERRANVARAFRGESESVSGLKVAVVDDVTTTGATLRACAVELKKAGAEQVWGLTVAREL